MTNARGFQFSFVYVNSVLWCQKLFLFSTYLRDLSCQDAPHVQVECGRWRISEHEDEDGEDGDVMWP